MHLRVPMQAHEVADSGIPRIGHEVVKGTFASGGINSLLQRASRKITVVVNESSPSRHNIKSSIPVSCNGGGQRPETILLVSENRSRVVSDHVGDAIIHPPLNRICVMKTSDRGRDYAFCTKATGLVQPDLL